MAAYVFIVVIAIVGGRAGRGVDRAVVAAPVAGVGIHLEINKSLICN
jgi:hypothetical protein